MNKLAGFLTLCVACALLRAAVVALVVAMIIALLWSFITQPRETLLLLGTLALMGLANAHPLACIASVTIVALAMVLIGRRRKSPKGRDSTVLIGHADDPESGG